MIMFFTDLDNTLIYSYKHDIGMAKRCVEVYQGREISFMTEETYTLLNKVKKAVTIVPVTTRTVEQYGRIDLGIGQFPYALVCNGGILLADGKEDALWYRKSLELVSDCTKELAYGEVLLGQDRNRCLEVRNIRGLFLFTKSKKPLESVRFLRKELDTAAVDVFCNGMKVYIVPKKLNKGNAVSRLRERVKADYVIAAGDSEFDVPMLLSAQLAFAPDALKESEVFAEIQRNSDVRHGGSGEAVQCAGGVHENIVFMRGDRVFSEELLTYIIRNCRKG